MIEILFLVIWTAIFLAIARYSWLKIRKHFKVYLLMIYNWLYLSGIFVFLPKLREAAGLF